MINKNRRERRWARRKWNVHSVEVSQLICLSGTVLEKEFNKFEQLLTDTEVKLYFSHKRRCCSVLGRP